MGGDFLLHRDCRFVEIGFYLHRVRRCVEIGFYLHRDCRYIGRCGTRSEMTLLFSSQMQTKFRRRFRVVFIPEDSYLGVLRLFLRVLEVARSRRLGRAREILAFLGKKLENFIFGKK